VDNKAKSATPIRALHWIAGALTLSSMAIGAMPIFIVFAPVVLALVLIVCNTFGIRKILISIGILVFLALLLYAFISSFIDYESMHMYDQNDTLVLIAFIACIAGCLGAILHIGIGAWQHKNKQLVT